MTPAPPEQRLATYGAYWTPLIEATPRLLGGLDRESLSPTWGSFDRDHWAWKFRDFPVILLQAGALPLAWLWRTPGPGNPWAGNPQVLRWICAALESVLARQHRNGAWDTVAPHSQDHGVTLAQCYTLATVAGYLGDACPSPLASRLREGLRRGTAFAARSDEDYAFISNHHALFALALLRSGQHLGDVALCRRADQVVEAILAHQSSEGWYAEYGGPDPGYESLGLHYLSQFEQERPSAALTNSIDRSLAFLAHCIHPDGSVGGGYGSRHTALWYPGGIERLAGRSAVASAIATFMRQRLGHGQVVTPQNVDPHNLPILLHSYALAFEAGVRSPADLPAEPLPWQRPAPIVHFPEAGLAVASTPAYFAICGLKKGGVLAVFDRREEALVHEDAGYVAEAGRRRWSSALLGLTESCVVEGPVARVTSRFGLAPRMVLTPFRFLVLRALNLTVFRSVTLGAFIRGLIISRLITGRRPGPLALHRTVTFEADRVVVQDRIEGQVRGLAKLWRPRAFTAIHMGSARYYHPRELRDMAEPRLDEAVAGLARDGAAALDFTVRFDGHAGSRPD